MISRWLVTNLPSWSLLLGIIVFVVGGAILVQVFVRRHFPGLKGEEHNDVIRFSFGVVGFVFAFFLGFVVSAMWGRSAMPTHERVPKGLPVYSSSGPPPYSIRLTATGSGRLCSNTSRQRWSSGRRSPEAVPAPRLTTP